MASVTGGLSRSLRNSIEESRDALDHAVPQHHEIRPLDRAVNTLGAETPREADLVAIAVRLADQCEAEIRKALLHAGDHGLDAVVPVAAHQRIDIACIAGPVGSEN